MTGNLHYLALSLFLVFVIWLVVATTAIVGHVSSVGSLGRFFGGDAYRHPRPDQATLTGFRARAIAVMQNHQEQAGFFVAALVANVWTATGGVTALAAQAAMVHVAARVAHAIFYLAGWSYLRTAAWSVGIVAVAVLLVEHL